MDALEQTIRNKSLERIAKVFSVSISDLKPCTRFGNDLKASFVSNFRDNEYDRIDQDIHDAADRKIMRELSNGKRVICTVNDYCDHMVLCFKTKPDDVKDILDM